MLVRILPMIVAFALPAVAQAVPVTGGGTAVRVTAPLADLGLTIALTGSATALDGGRVLFPISGGDLDAMTLAGQILHEGSGISLSTALATVGLGNFIIDTVASRLLADVTVNGVAFAEDLAILAFDLGSVTPAQLTDLLNPALALSFTNEAALALTTVFGAPDLTGAEFGLAATAPELAAAVPAPATLLLGMTGVVLLAARRRMAAR